MALWGNGVASQIIRIPDFMWFRGRNRFTVGAWYYSTTHTAETITMWRQDQTFTPVQSFGNYRVIYWNQSNAQVDTTAYVLNPFPTGEWVFLCATVDRFRVQAYHYRQSTGLYTGGSNTGPTSIYTVPTRKDMVVGGTETSTELMRSGDAIAELMVLNGTIKPGSIPALAAAPWRFRDRMVFYCPLRDSAQNATERVGGRSYRLVHGTTSRSQIDPGRHPPVSALRTRSR